MASLTVEGSSEGAGKIMEQPFDVIVLPTGQWKPVDGAKPALGFLTSLPVSFLGIPLPGKRVASSESWSFKVTAGREDVIGVTAQATLTGDKVLISGASTSKDEAHHQIRVTVDGVFLPSEGHFTHGRIEIDYTALVKGTKTKFEYQITRQ